MAKPSQAPSNVLTAALKSDLDELAVACRILEMEGHGSRMLGHMALRDPEGRGVWLKRYGLALSEVHDHRDFILIDFDGKQLFGDGKRHSEWSIHTEIMKRRADINVTAHTHPFYGRVFSAATEPLRPVANSGTYFKGAPPRFELTSELIRTVDVAAAMAEALADKVAIFLRNHGVVFCGDTAARATIMGIRLEEACREHLTRPDAEEEARKIESTGGVQTIRANFEFFRRRLEALEAQGHPSFPAKRLDVGL
jgi:ribulose-5-phosphate 4-epimerase/fuculose-1-phosphate aldolase